MKAKAKDGEAEIVKEPGTLLTMEIPQQPWTNYL